MVAASDCINGAVRLVADYVNEYARPLSRGRLMLHLQLVVGTDFMLCERDANISGTTRRSAQKTGSG